MIFASMIRWSAVVGEQSQHSRNWMPKKKDDSLGEVKFIQILNEWNGKRYIFMRDEWNSENYFIEMPEAD